MCYAMIFFSLNLWVCIFLHAESYINSIYIYISDACWISASRAQDTMIGAIYNLLKLVQSVMVSGWSIIHRDNSWLESDDQAILYACYWWVVWSQISSLCPTLWNLKKKKTINNALYPFLWDVWLAFRSGPLGNLQTSSHLLLLLQRESAWRAGSRHQAPATVPSLSLTTPPCFFLAPGGPRAGCAFALAIPSVWNACPLLLHWINGHHIQGSVLSQLPPELPGLCCWASLSLGPFYSHPFYHSVQFLRLRSPWNVRLCLMPLPSPGPGT